MAAERRSSKSSGRALGQARTPPPLEARAAPEAQRGMGAADRRAPVGRAAGADPAVSRDRAATPAGPAIPAAGARSVRGPPLVAAVVRGSASHRWFRPAAPQRARSRSVQPRWPRQPRRGVPCRSPRSSPAGEQSTAPRRLPRATRRRLWCPTAPPRRRGDCRRAGRRSVRVDHLGAPGRRRAPILHRDRRLLSTCRRPYVPRQIEAAEVAASWRARRAGVAFGSPGRQPAPTAAHSAVDPAHPTGRGPRGHLRRAARDLVADGDGAGCRPRPVGLSATRRRGSSAVAARRRAPPVAPARRRPASPGPDRKHPAAPPRTPRRQSTGRAGQVSAGSATPGTRTRPATTTCCAWLRGRDPRHPIRPDREAAASGLPVRSRP